MVCGGSKLYTTGTESVSIRLKIKNKGTVETYLNEVERCAKGAGEMGGKVGTWGLLSHSETKQRISD